MSPTTEQLADSVQQRVGCPDWSVVKCAGSQSLQSLAAGSAEHQLPIGQWLVRRRSQLQS